jgi:hypothetical protein
VGFRAVAGLWGRRPSSNAPTSLHLRAGAHLLAGTPEATTLITGDPPARERAACAAATDDRGFAARSSAPLPDIEPRLPCSTSRSTERRCQLGPATGPGNWP